MSYKASFDLPTVQPVRFFIEHGWGEGEYAHPTQHFHPELELYVHLEGNVSFMVEDTVHPVREGDVILSRPYEYHHCIYHDTAMHRHYWILISCEGNEALLRPFLDRTEGIGNHIVLSEENRHRLISVCRTLCEELPENDITRFSLLLRLLTLLLGGTTHGTDADLPADVMCVMAYIDTHMRSSLTVREMAGAAHTSVNTLERHFRAALGITPCEFLRVRRLTKARELLEKGASVQETSDACGFPDYSHFISLFRRRFGVTPLQYRRLHAASEQKD